MARLLPILAFVPLVALADARAAGEFSATIAAGKLHEECAKLGKGERRRFDWKADRPVDFDIHYHEGNEVFYPLKRANAKRGRGTFRAKTAQEYCWTWTAKEGEAKVEGRIRGPRI